MTQHGTRPEPGPDVESMIAAYQGPLIRYAYRLLRDRCLAEDMVQEAFLRYVRRPLAYGEPRQRVAWLYRVVHNLSVDWLTRESKRSEIYDRISKESKGRAAESNVVGMDNWNQLQRYLQKLSENQRWVILLFFEEGLSYKEIAEVTGFSMSNVGMLLHRGLKRLRTLLEKDGISFER
jgi:RNA polymerase sigma-70 factor (ECF subfamily)